MISGTGDPVHGGSGLLYHSEQHAGCLDHVCFWYHRVHQQQTAVLSRPARSGIEPIEFAAPRTVIIFPMCAETDRCLPSSEDLL